MEGCIVTVTHLQCSSSNRNVLIISIIALCIDAFLQDTLRENISNFSVIAFDYCV